MSKHKLGFGKLKRGQQNQFLLGVEFVYSACLKSEPMTLMVWTGTKGSFVFVRWGT